MKSLGGHLFHIRSLTDKFLHHGSISAARQLSQSHLEHTILSTTFLYCDLTMKANHNPPPGSPHLPSPRNHPPQSPEKSARFKVAILSLCIVTVAGSMDAAHPRPLLIRAGSTSVESSWIGASFPRTRTVTIPILLAR